MFEGGRGAFPNALALTQSVLCVKLSIVDRRDMTIHDNSSHPGEIPAITLGPSLQLCGKLVNRLCMKVV